MQVAMPLARVNCVRGIVIIDPVVHGREGQVNQGSGQGNRCIYVALDGPAAGVQCRNVGFLTGRCIVSKAKSDKVSPDLDTPTDLPPAAVDKISASLNTLLADAFALYLKTKNFHWHVSGRHFHHYHLMLDEQSDAIFATTDQLPQPGRNLGGPTPPPFVPCTKLRT